MILQIYMIPDRLTFHALSVYDILNIDYRKGREYTMLGEDILANRLLDWVLGELLDCPKNIIISKIRDRSKPENMESQIYNIIISTIQKAFSINDQETVFQMAEQFLKKLQEEQEISENTIQKGLRVIAGSQRIDHTFCMSFLLSMNSEIAKKQELANWMLLNKTSYMDKRLDNVFRGVQDLSKDFKTMQNDPYKSRINTELSELEGIKFNDEKGFYLDKWNARLFLHTRENDRPLTLEKTFIFPDYNLDGEDYDDLEEKLDLFFQLGNILILCGVPGIGKTSIVAKLANKYKENDKIVFLRFRYLGDYIEGDRGLLKAICESLKCKERNLKDCTIVLDGFDELKTSYSKFELLKSFLLDIRNVDELKVIITSRFNYIYNDILRNLKGRIINLKPYSSKKIREYYKQILSVDLPKEILIDNEEVLGVPVILYMALAVGIDFSKTRSRSELYERIFSLDSGIWDRFGNVGDRSYEKEPHLVSYDKDKLFKIMQLLAFQIFENEKKKKSISISDYIKIVNTEFENIKEWGTNVERIIVDFPISNLYEKSDGIEFVHKSIYEYFVAEYIYQEKS